MATDNTVTLISNFTEDPKLRFTANGAAVANLLPVTPRVRQGDQWTDGETSFFRVSCWRQLAENITDRAFAARRTPPARTPPAGQGC